VLMKRIDHSKSSGVWLEKDDRLRKMDVEIKESLEVSVISLSF
jgi:hypothetical protein